MYNISICYCGRKKIIEVSDLATLLPQGEVQEERGKPENNMELVSLLSVLLISFCSYCPHLHVLQNFRANAGVFNYGHSISDTISAYN